MPKSKREINPKYFRQRLRDLVTKESELLQQYCGNDQLILDAGCGDGRNDFQLVDELSIRPFRIVMLDINPKNLKAVWQNINADEITAPLFEPIIGSIFDASFPSDTFDVVISFGDVLSLANDGTIQDGLKEFRRVTKQGGVVLFSLVTKEFLLRAARDKNSIEKVKEIENTGAYTNWNKTFGEGIFKSWVESSKIKDRLRELGLDLLEMKQVCIDFKDITARLLLACRKR